MMNEKSGKVNSGLARAKSLTPERRKEIAMMGVEAKKLKEILPKATHGSIDHPLKIGEIEIPCYVLEDGTRVLSQRGLQSSIGMSLSGGKSGEQRIATFLDVISSKGIETNDLSARIRNPIRFYPTGGGRDAYGFEATILADICDVILQARKADKLLPQQQKLAEQCEILVRGFARVGIIALVDEATGYQRDRARDALARILEVFVAKELQPWVKTFPNDFYQELFRLRGLTYPTFTVTKPSYFGHLTNDIIYRRLAPGVLEELKKQAKKNDKGQLKHRLHQKLSTHVGHLKLRELLASVVTIMKLSSNYDDFKKKLDIIHAPYNETIPLFIENNDNGLGI